MTLYIQNLKIKLRKNNLSTKLILLALTSLFYGSPSYADPLNLTQSFGQADVFKPTMLTTDSSGNIYTQSQFINKNNNFIYTLEKISQDGIVLTQFPSLGGRIAISKDNNYIHEVKSDFINTVNLLTYDQTGNLIRNIKINNTKTNLWPDIKVDTNNKIYLSINKQIFVYDQAGNLIRTIKKYKDISANTSKAFGEIIRLAINDKNHLLILDKDSTSSTDRFRLILMDTEGKLLKPIRTVNGFFDLNAIALDNSDSIYLSGLIYNNSIAQSIIKKFKPNGNLSKAIKASFAAADITLDYKNNIILSDAENRSIQRLDTIGVFSKIYGPAPGMLAGVTDFALDTSNNVYVLDAGHKRIQKFSADGSLVTAQWQNTSRVNYFSKITISPDNKVYLATTNNEADVFTLNGDFLYTYTNPWPNFDKKGNIFHIKTVEQSNSTNKYYIEKLDQNAVLLKSFDYPVSSNSSTTSNLPCTSELVTDSQDHIYTVVCEATLISSHHGVPSYQTNAYLVKISDKDGSILKKQFISSNAGYGYMTKLAIDNRNIIYLSSADSYSNFITFALDQDLVKIGQIQDQFELPIKTDSSNNFYILASDQIKKYAAISLLKSPISSTLKQINKKGATCLTWEDRTNDETGFKVYRCQDIIQYNGNLKFIACEFKLIGRAAANITSLKFRRPTDLSLPSAHYQYFVTTIKDQEESLPSPLKELWISSE